MRKYIIIALMCVTSTALAGSFLFWWPNIGTNKQLDALACAAGPWIRSDQPWTCTATSYGAKCRFVANLSPWPGTKTEWELRGQYNGSLFQGAIIRTLPACTGFLCGFIAQVEWVGREAAPTPSIAQRYTHIWTQTGNVTVCEVTKNSTNVVRGTLYGSF